MYGPKKTKPTSCAHTLKKCQWVGDQGGREVANALKAVCNLQEVDLAGDLECVCVCVHMYVCVCVCVCVHAYVCMYGQCVWSVCMYVCM